MTSLRVYFDNQILNSPDFFRPRTGNVVKYKEMEITITNNNNIWWAPGENDRDTIPPELEEFVEKISLWSQISAIRTIRELGVYKHESAEATVDLESSGLYTIKILGKKMEHVRNLLRMIKVGSIRPNPDDSYERPQGGKSRSQLEDELGQAQMELAQCQELLNKTLNSLYPIIEQARSFVESLEKELFPFCTKARIIDQIRGFFKFKL